MQDIKCLHNVAIPASLADNSATRNLSTLSWTNPSFQDIFPPLTVDFTLFSDWRERATRLQRLG